MFTKIYYINLEHRTDRKDNVENQLKKINFTGPVERINAAYGKNLDLDLIPQNLFTTDAIKSTTNKNDLQNTQTMTKGGMGVAISHKWIYEKMLTSKDEYVLILEDDITLANNFMDSLNIHLKKIQKFDILWLGYHAKSNKDSTSDIDIPNKLWGLFVLEYKYKS